jgi:hypothetical protein
VKTSLPALCALAISLALPARAAPVPVEGAPYHRLVFSNDDLAVIETIVPPGGDSGFHRHSHELFYVVIAPAKVSTQRLGRELRAAPPLVPGSVGMNAMSDEPFIHRIVNPDKTAYHVVCGRASPQRSARAASQRPARGIGLRSGPRPSAPSCLAACP